jgi:hypothetical protein
MHTSFRCLDESQKRSLYKRLKDNRVKAHSGQVAKHPLGEFI